MLELKNISYSVKDENTGRMQEILKDVDLTFEDKGINVITGPNGSGKSTLIKLVMGFERPTEGKVLFNGNDITELGVTERARMGFNIAFQQPVRFKGITVKKLLELASGKKMNTEDMCDCLSSVGLCARNYIDRAVDGTLSGGELKRIELAMAVAKGGEVFLLDEPEAALSPRKQLELLAWIDLLVQRDSQFLIATHSPMLMAFPGAQVFQLSELGIEEVPYQETDHFQLMRAFLNCPDRLLHLLC